MKFSLGCEKLSFYVTHGLNEFFYTLGFHVALHPWRTILLSILTMAACGLGNLNFYYEENSLKLLMSSDSPFSRHTQWLVDKVSYTIRDEMVIVQADNVLTAEVLRQVAIFTKSVMELRHANTTWNDICVKTPNVYLYSQDDDSNNSSAQDVAVISTEPETFCQIFDNLDRVCLQDNLAAMWSVDADVIGRLTTEEILSAVAQSRVNPMNGLMTDYVRLLGGVRRNASGHIVGAHSMLINFFVNNTYAEADADALYNVFGNKDRVSRRIHGWEGAFNEKLEAMRAEIRSKHNITLYYSAAQGFFDAADDMWTDSLQKFNYGFIVMFIYVQLVLTSNSWLEVRFYVGICGLIGIAMALISGFGIGSACGYVVANTLISIPFLVLGLGVDDIFVIMGTLKQVRAEHQQLSLPEIMGRTMRHSGTSITITSLTNFVVFMVGMPTLIPALRSYYFIASCCILMTYIYVVTFFVAIVTLDERRIAERRNFLVPCISHGGSAEERVTLKAEVKQRFALRALENVFRNCILTKFGKIIALVPVILVTSNCFLHVLDISHKFDITSVVKRNTFYQNFMQQKNNFYPQLSHEAFAVLGHLNYSEEFPKIYRAARRLENATHLLDDFKMWPIPFQRFVNTYHHKDIGMVKLSEVDFKQYLYEFLFSQFGCQYQVDMEFERPLQCGQPAPDLKFSMMKFYFRQINNAKDFLPAKETIDGILGEAHLDTSDGGGFIWSQIFYYWLPTAKIDAEIFRNLSSGWISVVICTFLMIANFRMCALIQFCVILTMVDVLGLLTRFGINYDFFTLVALQVAVGLCVDYAVHIGHTFMTVQHTDKNERALRSVLDIGTSVFHGGASTLVMMAIGGISDSYASRVFLKCLTMVISFGLYHGMVVLPILLSWFGPAPYSVRRKVDKKEVPSVAKQIDATEFTIKTRL